ncbi:MAG: putative integral rane protein [Myxococcaceae bacterium]|nr:putative integral rane protein [Myxococcaceae bacterium]
MNANRQALLPKSPGKSKLRLWVVLALLIGLPFVVRASGLSSQLSVAHFRELVSQAGAGGALAFMAVFVAAVVAQVPGIPFVMVAPTLFGLPEAWLLCFVASNLAVVLNFAVVRKFGGQPFAELESPRLRKLFAELERHPIRTVALLRTLTVMFPPVTGALALTRVSARDHALGSALGMVPPVTAILLAAEAIVRVVP